MQLILLIALLLVTNATSPPKRRPLPGKPLPGKPHGNKPLPEWYVPSHKKATGGNKPLPGGNKPLPGSRMPPPGRRPLRKHVPSHKKHLTWSELVDAVESEVAFKLRFGDVTDVVPFWLKMSQKKKVMAEDEEEVMAEALEDSSEDEEEVMAEKEDSFFVRNELPHSSVFVTYGCDREVVKYESTEITGKITGSYGGAEGSVEAGYKTEKEFEHFFVSKTGATAVVPGGFLEEGVAKSCDMVYATMYVRNSDGRVNRFMNTSGTHKGKVIVISGTPDKVEIEKSYEACGGQKCGCWRGKCWSYCSFGQNWCYTNTHGKSQNYKYKYCSKNDECRPGNKCAGPCSL